MFSNIYLLCTWEIPTKLSNSQKQPKSITLNIIFSSGKRRYCGRGWPDRLTSVCNDRRTGLEANVLVLLPVAAGHSSLHAGALGADCVQFHAGSRCGDGTAYRICSHASANHSDVALLKNCSVYQDVTETKRFLREESPSEVGMRLHQMS